MVFTVVLLTVGFAVWSSQFFVIEAMVRGQADLGIYLSFASLLAPVASLVLFYRLSGRQHHEWVRQGKKSRALASVAFWICGVVFAVAPAITFTRAGVVLLILRHHDDLVTACHGKDSPVWDWSPAGVGGPSSRVEGVFRDVPHVGFALPGGAAMVLFHSDDRGLMDSAESPAKFVFGDWYWFED